MSARPGGAVKIEMVLPSLEIGGMETMVATLVRTLHQRGCSVSVTCLLQVGEIGFRLREEGFEVCQAGSSGVRDLVNPKALRNHLLALAPTLIHVHSGAWLKTSRALGRHSGIPLVCTIHGVLEGAGWGDRLMMRLAAARTAKVIPVSDALNEYLVHRVGVPSGMVETVPNGVDCARFRPHASRASLRSELGLGAETVLVGAVARLVWVKNLPNLLHAFARVAAAVGRSHLVIVGDGPLRAELLALVRVLGLEGRVHFLGGRPDPEEIFPQFDLFVLASRAEGTSMSILEAMASGVPVVATAVGGTPALLDHGNAGVLVPSEDPGALAGAVISVLGDSTRRAVLGEAGLSRARGPFSLAHMVDRYQEVYARVIGADRPALAAGAR
jgi:glycosyltransferase involved in cell wall biosynthesis